MKIDIITMKNEKIMDNRFTILNKHLQKDVSWVLSFNDLFKNNYLIEIHITNSYIG